MDEIIELINRNISDDDDYNDFKFRKIIIKIQKGEKITDKDIKELTVQHLNSFMVDAYHELFIKKYIDHTVNEKTKDLDKAVELIKKVVSVFLTHSKLTMDKYIGICCDKLSPFLFNIFCDLKIFPTDECFSDICNCEVYKYMMYEKNHVKHYKKYGAYRNVNYDGNYGETLFKLLETLNFFFNYGIKITQDMFTSMCVNLPFEAIMLIRNDNDINIKFTEECFQGIVYNQLLSLKQARTILKYFKFVMTTDICNKILKHYKYDDWLPDPRSLYFMTAGKLKQRVKGLKISEHIEKLDDTFILFCEKHNMKLKKS